MADPARGGEQQHEQQHGRERDRDARVDVERVEERGEAGAGHAAERPAGVQRGHDRLAEVVLHLHAVAVHGDVLRRRRGAEHEEPSATSAGCGASTGRLTASAAPIPPTHTIRSEPWRTIAWPAIGKARMTAIAMPDDDEAHRALGEVEALLDPRDLRDPGADRGAVDDEDAGRGPAWRSCAGHRDAEGAVGVEQLVGRGGLGDDVGELGDRRDEVRAAGAELVRRRERDHVGGAATIARLTCASSRSSVERPCSGCSAQTPSTTASARTERMKSTAVGPTVTCARLVEPAADEHDLGGRVVGERGGDRRRVGQHGARRGRRAGGGRARGWSSSRRAGRRPRRASSSAPACASAAFSSVHVSCRAANEPGCGAGGSAPPCTRWTSPWAASSRRSRRIVSSETPSSATSRAATTLPSRASVAEDRLAALGGEELVGCTFLHERAWYCMRSTARSADGKL